MGPASEKKKENADIREQIKAEYSRITSSTHYEILGVSQKADASSIQKAFVKAARKWHNDRFAAYSLEDEIKLVDKIFSRINQAKDVLLNKKKREEYDIFLDRKAKGLPTDVETILKAEDCFLAGEKMFNAGNFSEALKQFEEAILLNHAEPEFYAWRGYARFMAMGPQSKDKAIEDIRRCLRENPDMESANMFLGKIALREKNHEEAERSFRKVLKINKKNGEAEKLLEKIETEQKKNSGLISRFFNKS